jgi:hypothetical protein
LTNFPTLKTLALLTARTNVEMSKTFVLTI